MMTLTQVERLVRKLAEIVADPGSDAQTAKLAQEYAEVCRAANRRLEQCAVMIEAGQFLQALQLAETAPPLLDLITLLGFRQASELRSHCQAHQLPWAEPFYDKYIRLLNNAYSKGISGDHPFYRDYRRAVMENDDTRAQSILRVIARMNPTDANTRDELKRLEEKLLRIKLENLRQVMAAGDPANIQAALEQLEASGLPVPASHPVWQQAQVFRCQQMLRRAEQFREQEAWREVETVVEEIHAFATRYNVRLPDADADSFAELDEWTTGQRTAYATEQDFQRAVSALEYEVKSRGSQHATGARLNRIDATAAFDSLTAKWNEAGRFGKALPAELEDECQQCCDWFEGEIRAAARRKRLISVAIVVVILGAVVAAIPFALGRMREANYAKQFEQLETQRKVSEAENLLAQIPESWKSNVRMYKALGEVKDFLTREKALKQTFDQKIGGLQQLAATGFRNVPPQTGLDRASCNQAIARLAPEYKSAAEKTLADWDAQWQPFRNAEIGRLLGRAEEAANALGGTNGPEPARAGLASVQALRSELAPYVAEPPPLDAALSGRFSALTNKLAKWAGAAGKWEQTQTALNEASSVDLYLAALAQLGQSPLATPAQKEAARIIENLKPNEETLLGELLLPKNRSAWGMLTNVSGWSNNLMPDQLTEAEKAAFLKLRDDKNVHDVFAYKLTPNPRPDNPSRTNVVFVQGAMSPDRTYSAQEGLVHDPTINRDSLHFVHASYTNWFYSKVELLRRLAECDSFERLGLGEPIDANTGKFPKPILRLFDELNQDTKASAVFRAFITLKLLAVAELRPAAWGWSWCPGVEAHIQGLAALEAREIQSGDWMVPERVAKFEGLLQNYFAKARAISLEKQARFLQQLVHDACAKGFVFAGFIDAAGQPVLRTSGSFPEELCGWGTGDMATVVLRKTPGAQAYVAVAEPLPYTPLFVFAGDRRELLHQTLLATGYPVDKAGSILPPFFGGAP